MSTKWKKKQLFTFTNVLFQHPSLIALFSSSALFLLMFVQVVFFCKLEVFQKLGIHSLHFDPLFGRGFAGRIPMMFSVLVMIGMILWLCHCEFKLLEGYARNKIQWLRKLTFWQKMAPINKKNANHVMSIIVYFWRKEFMERLFVLIFFLFLIVVDLEVSEFCNKKEHC